MSRVLITGAAGLVAAALADAYRDHDVVALAHGDLDITDGLAVEALVQRERPDIIFNCAVIGVDACESDPLLASRVNELGPTHLASAAERVGAAIVHFSSNYVFDGDRAGGLPYTIEDEPRPINVYGTTKLLGERAVTRAASRAFVIRTSWVFGAAKSSFLGTVAARLRRGERVQAIRNTFASTTFVGDLASRVVAIVERGDAGTYHVVNAGVCSYETFAREAARLVDARATLIETTLESRPAPRPRWTPMRCLLSERLGLPPMRGWESALAEYAGARTKW